MPPHKVTTPNNVNPRGPRRHKRRQQPQRKPEKANLQTEEWGSTRDPWPSVIDESDVSKEIIRVWRQNVYDAENGGELQKMEDLYDRLDRERVRWNERLNNPLTWGWGGEPDELNDWARHSTNDAVHVQEPQHWGGDRQARSDRTPDRFSGERKPDQETLLKFYKTYESKLSQGGRERSSAFAQLSAQAKAEKIRETAYQLAALPLKHQP